MTTRQRVILITGASSGIGQLCATLLHQRGYRVYGTSRRAAVSAPYPMLEMNVDEDDSVQRGIERIVSETGRLDGVVNNAGYSLVGAVEETSIEEAKAHFETNFFGALRVCRAALPVMRQQRRGHIVNISSLGGEIGLPFQGIYSATKFALEGMTEALRLEVRPFGIHAVLIQPGDCATGLTASRRSTAESLNGTAYQPQFSATVKRIQQDEARGGSPIAVAQLLDRILAARSPKPRYRVGPFIEQLAVIAKPNLPGKVFDWLMRQFYALP
ncbi:MAG: SDR family oxidoreductase [Thermoflexales bacterium]|nr:SDR family oxidoreductase [Thermoflexales bacterium]